MRFLSTSLAALCLAALCLAASSAAAHFLPPGLVDPAKLLPPPPAADSVTQRQELDLLLRLQAERTPAQVAQAKRVDAEEAFTFGAAVLGDWFTAANLPKTAHFIEELREDIDPYNRAAKAHFNRRRPPFVEPKLSPCVEVPDTGAYPSGHAMRSALWAAVFSAVVPEETGAFNAKAAESRWARLLGGAHYPSDVEAGRIYGEALARELLKNPAMQQVIRDLREEFAAHRLKRAA